MSGSIRHMFVDLETFSSVDLKKSGVYRYVTAKDFTILLFAYAFENEQVQIVDLTKDNLPEVVADALIDPNVIKHAHNANFEITCLNAAYNIKLDASQWRCSMAHALYCGYPASLDAATKALGLPAEKLKDKAGNALIKIFSTPQKPTRTNGNRTRILPHHEPEKWELYKRYCMQDVEAERAIERKLEPFPFPESEQLIWELDQRINDEGVAVDKNLVIGALQIGDTASRELTLELQELTGLSNPNSDTQFKNWLQTQTTTPLENVRKETLNELIDDPNLSEKGRRGIELRLELKKTSIKKYDAIINSITDDGRVRGMFQYYGANRSGRWAGRLVQLHNLPRNYIKGLKSARQVVKASDIDLLRVLYGNAPDTLSQLLRTAFVPTQGNVLLVADYSAIEARVISWLAGEKWRQEVFATHGKIYEASASAMFGVPIERISKGNPEYELRQKGKIAELALGYQGSKGALITMGALKQGLTEAELPEIVDRWRSSNKRIVDLWQRAEQAALSVLRSGSPVGIPYCTFRYETANGLKYLTVQLPSGRKLYYASPKICEGKFGNDAICYMGMNQTSKKWEKTDTYGGKLVENIVQAISRDVLCVALVRLSTTGYKIVASVHDEVVIDHPDAAALDNVCELMCLPIAWAEGLQLNADGFVGEFYKK